MNLTPNIKALVIERSSQITSDRAGDAGGQFGKACAIGARLATPGKFWEDMKEALTWVEAAIKCVRLAAEPNPWVTATDEEIAGEVMRLVSLRRRQHQHPELPATNPSEFSA